ncbi:NAD-dependent epimerase/dehydratase family protein [Streptomyces chartreusis]|uniref:NAD-dependent epimerase/dehydratase family protein n=1 Tax=Streptomyces chartreusis TaxID=1969 RepID=UPI00142EA006|nr:NAD-dependent epimerase/dehydratase family protein [Streptomyces chartreusis]GGW98613.1 CDP-paratose 2-epimerase [Streptomyces chartreusis]
MRVLVTGAAGFIGSHLVTQLAARSHHIIAMDKRNGLPTTDLSRLQRIVRRTEPDIIVHLGASCSTQVSLEDPARDFTDNVVGTFNVAEAARQASVPVIYTSTVKVHHGADGLIAPLGLSKMVGEDYLALYGDLYGLRHIILRPSTVYGPGQDGSPEAGWVTWFLRAYLDQQQITIHGDGRQSRDILHVDDFTTLLVDMVERFPEYGGFPHMGRTYDVGGGPENEVSLRALLALLGHDNVIHGQRLPGDLQRVVTDNTDVSAVRGWKPCVPWKDGVLATLDHMRRQP